MTGKTEQLSTQVQVLKLNLDNIQMRRAEYTDTIENQIKTMFGFICRAFILQSGIIEALTLRAGRDGSQPTRHLPSHIPVKLLGRNVYRMTGQRISFPE